MNIKCDSWQAKEICCTWRQLASAITGELGRSAGGGGWADGQISRKKYSSLRAEPHADCKNQINMVVRVYLYDAGGHDLQGQLHWQPHPHQCSQAPCPERE